jgi:hypothetical protein
MIYNSQQQQSVFPKNLVNKFSVVSNQVVDGEPPDLTITTQEIIECNSISLTNITLSGEQTISDVTLVAGSICIVAGQSDKKTNGVYNVQVGTWERIGNDLNTISIFVVNGGDYENYGYYLKNKPIELDIDDIEFIQLWSGGGNDILSKEITFTGTELNLITSGFVTLFPGLTGKSYDIISAMLKVVKTSGNASGDIKLGYENGLDEQFQILENVLDGTGTAYYKLTNNPIQSINYALGDGFGLFEDPTFTFSGTITLTLTLTYRII